MEYKQVLTRLVNVKTGKIYEKWLTEKQLCNLPFHICYPYELESRKEELNKMKGGLK